MTIYHNLINFLYSEGEVPVSFLKSIVESRFRLKTDIVTDGNDRRLRFGSYNTLRFLNTVFIDIVTEFHADYTVKKL